jgi:antitoxin (DNA-binding transcriptional repressor) of toxin-antitoxin stability system
MMDVMTVKRDQAHIHMHDILDETVAGREVIIQRDDKPVAVVILYEQWKARKIADAFTEAKQILAKIKHKESKWVNSDEVMHAVLAKQEERLAKGQTAIVDAK